MKDWNYENEQWTQLPPHLKHLPLFTRHFDLTSWFFRVLWGIYMKAIAFRFYIRLQVVGDRFDDAAVLRFCAAWEREFDWRIRRPAVFAGA